MKKDCPNCEKSLGIREGIYGMPSFEPDENKYFIAGCTSNGPRYVCIDCRWGIADEEIQE
jgi:hypothetical protein